MLAVQEQASSNDKAKLLSQQLEQQQQQLHQQQQHLAEEQGHLAKQKLQLQVCSTPSVGKFLKRHLDPSSSQA